MKLFSLSNLIKLGNLIKLVKLIIHIQEMVVSEMALRSRCSLSCSQVSASLSHVLDYQVSSSLWWCVLPSRLFTFVVLRVAFTFGHVLGPLVSFPCFRWVPHVSSRFLSTIFHVSISRKQGKEAKGKANSASPKTWTNLAMPKTWTNLVPNQPALKCFQVFPMLEVRLFVFKKITKHQEQNLKKLGSPLSRTLPNRVN